MSTSFLSHLFKSSRIRIILSWSVRFLKHIYIILGLGHFRLLVNLFGSVLGLGLGLFRYHFWVTCLSHFRSNIQKPELNYNFQIYINFSFYILYNLYHMKIKYAKYDTNIRRQLCCLYHTKILIFLNI